LETIAAENNLAAIVMEPIRNEEPKDGFLGAVREVADRENIPLVVDEITAGFRVRPGGYHEELDLEPDITVLGKALGNGYPISAVVGKEYVMQAAQDSFISSTFWTERIGPNAALATIEKFRDESVGDHLVQIGNLVTNGWRTLAEDNGLPIETNGIKPLTTFEIDHEQGQAATTLFTQMMLDRGFLAGHSVYASYAHTEAMVEQYLEAVDEVFGEIATAITKDSIDQKLRGPVAHTKFERLN